VTETEILTHTIKGDEAGGRIDKLIAELGLVPSRSFGQRLIDRGLVTVNGSMVGKHHVARAGEYLEVKLPPPVETQLEPEEIPLDVRFEDEHLIVLSKPAGMVVHPTDTHRSGTLVHALLAHCDSLGSLGGVERPGIVHRLDKDTSGLMLVAKDDATQAALSDAIRIRAVDRRYCCLVHGLIAPDTGIVDAPVGRHPKDRMRMAVTHDPSSRQAVTNFSVLERFDTDFSDDGFTLLECKLHTGRTHQIRVHMAYIDHHVVGDQTYGRKRRVHDLGLTRQFLHSYRLRLEHPMTGEELDLADPVPEDLRERLATLSERSMGVTAYGEQVVHTVRGGPGA
jgi:23S rRNA pseudouridine1911/1915/1917 synthase